MRATDVNSLLAVSVLLLTIVCTTVPARARVDISCAQVGDTNEVIINFDANSEPNLIRAFALDILYFNKIETLVPECDKTEYNFWLEP